MFDASQDGSNGDEGGSTISIVPKRPLSITVGQATAPIVVALAFSYAKRFPVFRSSRSALQSVYLIVKEHYVDLEIGDALALRSVSSTYPQREARTEVDFAASLAPRSSQRRNHSLGRS